MQTPNLQNLLQSTGANKPSNPHAKNQTGPVDNPGMSPKQSLDAAIVNSVSVTLGVKESPLSLVQQTAVDHINDLLREEFGANALESAYEQGIDVSPEATAERIVSMSTGFFSAYRSNHPEMSEEEARVSFVDIISSGIDQGFDEARDILRSLSVLEGEIAENIDETYELVQLGLEDFLKAAEEDDGPDISDGFIPDD